MMKRKHSFAVVSVALILAVSLTACGGNTGQSAAASSTPQSSAATSEPAAQPTENSGDKIVIKVGCTSPEGSNYYEGLVIFEQKLEEYTDKVDVQIFPNSVLGSERDLVEGVALGTVEMCLTSTGPLPSMSPSFMVFDLPYIITDRNKAFEVMDGPIGQEILGTLDPMGIYGMGFWENGFRHITNNKEEILLPKDINGMKIRTMENKVHMEAFKQMKANPTPMAWGEVFNALQQGVIDGHENALTNIYSNKVYEVQKYVSLTGHFYSPAVMMINKSLFEGFDPDIQEAIVKAEKDARDWEREFCIELDENLIVTLKELGVTITEVDVNVWKEATKGTYDVFKDELNPDHVAALMG